MARMFSSGVAALCAVATVLMVAGAQAEEGGERGEQVPGIDVAGVRWMPEAQVRARGELWVIPDEESTTEEPFVTSRVRVGLAAEHDWLRVHVQLQDARLFGDTAIGVDPTSSTGVHQGYIELRAPFGSVRLGRQEVSYGDERMIGALDWSSAGRSFDALRLHGRDGALELDVLGAMVRMPRTITLTSPGNPDTLVSTEGDYLGVVYGSLHRGKKLTFDHYVLFRHDGPTEPSASQPPAEALIRERNIAAPGVRLTGKPNKRVRATGEATYQLGRAAQKAHSAFAVSADFTYRMDPAIRPAVTVGGAYATGDSNNGRFD